MNIKLNDWVMRVPYPECCVGFTQTYEHVVPNAANLVTSLNTERESIIVRVFCDGKYYEEEFWAGNFLKVKLEPILSEKWKTQEKQD